MPANIQNIHTSHSLITWIVFLSMKHTDRVAHERGDSCDSLNFVVVDGGGGFWQLLAVGRLTPVGGRQYVVSGMEQERGVFGFVQGGGGGKG